MDLAPPMLLRSGRLVAPTHCFFLFFYLILGSALSTTNQLDYIVEVTAAAQSSPAQITLNWADPYYSPSSSLPGTEAGYDIIRRDEDFRTPTLWRSTDSGATWAPIPNAPSASFRSITYSSHNGGVWMAVGDHGVVYTSADNGLTWTHRPVLAQTEAEGTSFYGVTSNGSGAWVMAGHNSRAYTSFSNGATWTRSTTVANGGQNPRAVAFGNGRWILGGGRRDMILADYYFYFVKKILARHPSVSYFFTYGCHSP